MSEERAASHKQRTLSGIAWNFIAVFGQTILTLGTGIILARILTPEDFGVLTIATVFIGIADLVSSLGMGAAIIQRKELTPLHLRTATTLSILTGGALFLVLWASAPTIAAFFGEPLLATILPVLAAGLTCSAASAASRGLLARRMNFRQLFIIEFTAYLLGYAGLSILLAHQGYGAWSLVWGSTLSLVIQSLAALYLAPAGRPCLPPRKETRDLLGFGGGMSLNSTINYLASNVDYLTIGKFINAAQLGLYQRAYQLAMMPQIKIAATLSGALFPSYAEIQDNPGKIGRAFLMSISATSLFAFPTCIGFIVIGDAVILSLYGAQWLACVPAFKVLAVAGTFKGFANLCGPVVKATGHLNGEIRRQLGYLPLLAVACLFAARYGIEAVASAVVIGSLWLYLSMAQLACRIVGVAWKDFLAAHLPGLVLAALTAGVLFLLQAANDALLQLSPTQNLIYLLAGAALGAMIAMLFLPSALLGQVPGWIFRHYAHKLPGHLRSFVERRFPG